MSTAAHILSASLIGLLAADVAPSERSLIAISIVSASAVDIDHIYYLIKDRKFYKKNGLSGNLHKARSFLHELIGFVVLGIIMLVISFFNAKLAIVIGIPAMVHLTEDVIVGTSIPFAPFDKTEMRLIVQNQKVKAFVDIFVIIIFGSLWIQYLTATS